MRATNKILIAMQYWGGDRDQAGKLLKFLADIEPKHSDVADVLLVSRHDCVQLPDDLDAYVSRKFNLWLYHAPRGNVGWPAGCNSLWRNTIGWVQGMSAANKIPTYKAIFTCEADGCPVFSDWTARMSEAWDKANAARPVCVAGPIVKVPGEHMNGNLMVSGNPETLKWVLRAADGIRINAGWDWVLSPQFKQRGWANIPGMVSYYNTRDYTVENFAAAQQEQLIWIHGVKDDSLMKHGRHFLLGEPA